jgi:hypothetical protein
MHNRVPPCILFSINSLLINIVPNEVNKNLPSKVEALNCFMAKACGRWLPPLSITLQGYTSLHHLSFHSVHCHPPASATTLARVLPFIPFRSCLPTVSFRSLLASPDHRPELKPKREAPFNPTPFVTFHSVTTLAFPDPISGMP